MSLPALADCKPGFVPTEFKVLIVVADALKVSQGGIILPPDKAEADQAASMRGRLVAVSPQAGGAGIWPDDGPARPQPGDEVVFAKYAGVLITGDDGREYRACFDKDIIAVCNRETPNG